MILLKFIDFLIAHRKALRWVCYAALAACVIASALVDTSHVHTEVEKIPGFWAAFGLIGCIIIIEVSKFIGSLGLMKEEDYYDDE